MLKSSRSNDGAEQHDAAFARSTWNEYSSLRLAADARPSRHAPWHDATRSTTRNDANDAVAAWYGNVAWDDESRNDGTAGSDGVTKQVHHGYGSRIDTLKSNSLSLSYHDTN